MKKVDIVPSKFSKEFPNPKLVFLIGPPGSGKRTICSRLEDELNVSYISVTKLLADETLKGTTAGK